MKFLGPLSKDLTGRGAEELLAQSRVLLGQVRNQMKLGGLKQGWGYWDVDSTSRMRCYSNQNGAAPIDIVWIETIGGEELKGWVMEHGFFALYLPDLNEDPVETTADVYVPAEIVTRYEDGTVLPSGDTAAIVGRLVINEHQTSTVDGELVGQPSWPDGAPLLTNGKHTSYHGPGADEYDYIVGPDPFQAGDIRQINYKQNAAPGSFTGLARAWMQALLGAGFNDSERSTRMPAGFSGSSGALGIVVDPDGHYWACDISSAGLKMHLMVSGKTTAIVAQWLRDNPFPDVDMSLLRAYVLADLTPSTEGTHIVLTVQQMAAVYDDGKASPFQAGWVWSPVAAKAAIVTARSYADAFSLYSAYESALSTVTISWQLEGDPQRLIPHASVDVGTFYRFRPFWAYHKFWIGNSSSVNMIRCNQNFPGASDCDAVAPVVCYYIEDGTLEVWEYHKGDLKPIEQSAVDTQDGLCGSYTSRTGSTNLKVVTGGYQKRGGASFGSNFRSGDLIVGGGSYSWDAYTISGGGDTVDTIPFSYSYLSSNINDWDSHVRGGQNSYYQVCPCGACWPDTTSNLLPPFDPALAALGLQYGYVRRDFGGSGTYTRSNESLGNASGSQVLVYLGESPDVLWETAANSWSSRSGLYNKSYHNPNMKVHTELMMCVFRASPRTLISLGGTLITSAIVTGVDTGTLSSLFSVGYDNLVNEGTSIDYGAWSEITGKVHVAGQVTNTDVVYSDFACLWDNGLESCDVGLIARVSANFNAWYNDMSRDPVSNNAGLIGTESLSSSTSALAWVGGA